MARKWELVTAELDSRARGGDPAAICEKLAQRGKEEKTETAVWIDHSTERARAEAVTSGLSTQVYLPGSVLTRMRDAQKRMELWHNHPYADGAPGNAVPSAEDIGAAMMPGVTALTTVDDNGRWTKIWRCENVEYHPRVVAQWVENARNIAERALTMNNPPPVDEEEEHRRAERAAEAGRRGGGGGRTDQGRGAEPRGAQRRQGRRKAGERGRKQNTRRNPGEDRRGRQGAQTGCEAPGHRTGTRGEDDGNDPDEGKTNDEPNGRSAEGTARAIHRGGHRAA